MLPISIQVMKIVAVKEINKTELTTDEANDPISKIIVHKMFKTLLTPNQM